MLLSFIKGGGEEHRSGEDNSEELSLEVVLSGTGGLGVVI